jgi:hypothetical protein
MPALNPEFSNAPALTTEGRQMWRAPTAWGANTIVKRLPECAGCARIDDHDVAEWIGRAMPAPGTGRYSLVTANNRPDITRLHRLQTLMFLYGRTFFGLVGDAVLYNAGQAADNASQRYQFRIVSGEPGKLTLRGRHPGLLGLTASRINPEWPFADPITGEYSRIIFMGGTTSLPAGCVVEYLFPSILTGRTFPIVSKIIVPGTYSDIDDVQFEVEIGNNDGTNARAPYDSRYPAAGGLYFCFLRWQALAREDWKDFQAQLEMQVVRRRITVNNPGVVALTNSDDDPTRVIPESVQVVAFPPVPLNIPALLSTTGPPYATTLNLTGTGIEIATINYICEATGDEINRVPTMGQCRWAKKDPSGSWIHGTDQHCAKAATASGFAAGLFHDGCWLPGRCNQFQVFDESTDTFGNAEWWASLWTRSSWVLFQGLPGISSHRNFWLVWREGPSIAGLTGSWTDTVFQGRFERREEWNGTPLGRRETYTTTAGDFQALIKGGIWEQAHRFPETSDPGDGALEYRANANSTSLRAGTIASIVDDWEVGKDNRNRYPWRYTASTGTYEFTTGGESMRNVNTFTTSEAIVAAANLETSGGETVERLRPIYGGT